jgi:hypothetical protein
MVTCLNMLSVIFAFAAAASWFYSAKLRVKPVEDERDEHGMRPATITVGGADVFKSLRAQSKWSAIAALLAGGAAVMQGIVLLL